MFDAHAIARALTDAGIEPAHADAITAANTAEPLATRADIAELEARLTWRFAGAMLAQTGLILAAVIGAAVAILRTLAS